jgi:hypothetical protein
MDRCFDADCYICFDALNGKRNYSLWTDVLMLLMERKITLNGKRNYN